MFRVERKHHSISLTQTETCIFGRGLPEDRWGHAGFHATSLWLLQPEGSWCFGCPWTECRNMGLWVSIILNLWSGAEHWAIPSSSGDSTGASPDESKQRYDNVVNQHPNTILTLNHETIGTYLQHFIFSLAWRIKFPKQKQLRKSCCRPKGISVQRIDPSPLHRSQVLPYAISKLQGAGYRLVTVAECLGLPAYQSVGGPQPPDVSTFYVNEALPSYW